MKMILLLIQGIYEKNNAVFPLDFTFFLLKFKVISCSF